MLGVRVATWNAEGMFVVESKTRRASPNDALAVLKEIDADVVFIPEFGEIGRLDKGLFVAIEALGYRVLLCEYGQPAIGPNGIALLTRLPLLSSEIHAFSNTGRRYIEAIIKDRQGDKLRFIGVHFDDRCEALRLGQVDDLCRVLRNKDMTTVP